jgi:alpha-1,6-mannosyltransferase
VSGRWLLLLGLIGCGLTLLALTGLGLAAQAQNNTAAFVVVACAQGAVYLAAIGLIRRPAASGQAITVILILGAAAAMRVALVLAPPYLSSDIYRYVWDGRVIAAGINPYRYVPADPHLAALRDPQIFPNINRSDYAHTIYPPAAEAVFYAVTRLSESPTAMKAAMVGFEMVAVALLLRLLVSCGRPATRIMIYLWHPLPLWEFAGSGHIDAAIVALVALALWSRRRAIPAGACPWAGPTGTWLATVVLAGALAGGTLVKFYPAVILPALWRRWDWRMPVIFAGSVILAYLPFVAVGWRVFGFLPQYAVEEGFTAGGSGFYLWNIIKSVLPPGRASDIAYLAGAACLLAALAVYVGLRRSRPGGGGDVRSAALLAGTFTLLLSPHYPWYFAWLIVFACLVPSAALVWLTLASFLLYLVSVWPQLMQTERWLVVQSVLYVPFALLGAAELWRQRRRRREQANNGS